MARESGHSIVPVLRASLALDVGPPTFFAQPTLLRSARRPGRSAGRRFMKGPLDQLPKATVGIDAIPAATAVPVGVHRQNTVARQSRRKPLEHPRSRLWPEPTRDAHVPPERHPGTRRVDVLSPGPAGPAGELFHLIDRNPASVREADIDATHFLRGFHFRSGGTWRPSRPVESSVAFASKFRPDR